LTACSYLRQVEVSTSILNYLIRFSTNKKISTGITAAFSSALQAERSWLFGCFVTFGGYYAQLLPSDLRCRIRQNGKNRFSKFSESAENFPPQLQVCRFRLMVLQILPKHSHRMPSAKNWLTTHVQA